MNSIKLECRAVDSLIPYARNTKQHSDAQIAASIREFGLGAPIPIDGSSIVIAGRCRLLAARKLVQATSHLKVKLCWAKRRTVLKTLWAGVRHRSCKTATSFSA
jgi:hypothetical protein